MANVKIGDLLQVTSLNSTDILPCVDVGGDTTYKITVQDLANSLTQVTQSISASYALNGGVTSIIAGTGISVNTSTGNVTITNTGGGGGSAFPYTGSAKITGSLDVVGPLGITGSINTSAGVRLVDGIYIKDSGGGYNNYIYLDGNNNLSITAYPAGGYGLRIVDGGGNLFANFLGSMSTPEFTFTGSAKIKGDLNISNGQVYGTSSWALNVVGGASAFPFTGSAQITGSLGVTGSVSVINGGFTGSLFGTASYAQTASYLNDLNQNVTITGSLIISGSPSPEIRVIGEMTITGSLIISGTAPLRIFGTASIASGSLAVGNITASSTVGRIDASNDIVAYSTSDVRLKTEIVPIQDPITKVNMISGINFTWIENPEVHGNSGKDVGVIAQELEAVLPEVVTTRENGYKAVKYEKIVPLLIEAIKDLQKQIDELKAGK